ncbi:nickel/cobalt transporter [Roseospira marina]|uniref:nickel/cobalt transporter n=1 Tax=Roseospira marina TaxID=140057 RepID=UPI001479774A|nr:nickel/cobalt transporter [Roseospira marina]MBB4315618.1 ABC-type nickel/cobalt efflux system permease component RcnA [Roseospira marina]MBB5088614.1 ABC-type nickel/cobalt efflux system permease component RcnA [Roseospira marina]
MSVNASAGRIGRRAPWGLLLVLGLALAAGLGLVLLPPGWASAALTWVRTVQGEYQLALKDAVLALREEHPGTAALTLAGLSFLYGVLHAVGPGHGKAVIGTYAAANLRQVRRAVILSLAAGLVQALSAITLVSAAFLLIHGGARWATQAGDRYLEPASYAVIAGLGGWVALRAVWPWLKAWVGGRTGASSPSGTEPPHAPSAPDLSREPHHHHDHGHHGRHDHGEGCGCGHAHMPTPDQVTEAGSWRQIAALAVAIGLRPCTGAILVLILSFSVGLWAAGVAAALCMGLGTALTVSVLAAVASTLGKTAVPQPHAGRAFWWRRLLGLAGGSVIFGLGLVLFLAAVQRPTHPLL